MEGMLSPRDRVAEVTFEVFAVGPGTRYQRPFELSTAGSWLVIQCARVDDLR
jgi:hypothetical protein